MHVFTGEYTVLETDRGATWGWKLILFPMLGRLKAWFEIAWKASKKIQILEAMLWVLRKVAFCLWITRESMLPSRGNQVMNVYFSTAKYYALWYCYSKAFKWMTGPFLEMDPCKHVGLGWTKVFVTVGSWANSSDVDYISGLFWSILVIAHTIRFSYSWARLLFSVMCFSTYHKRMDTKVDTEGQLRLEWEACTARRIKEVDKV